jgi:hypothetical protein
MITRAKSIICLPDGCVGQALNTLRRIEGATGLLGPSAIMRAKGDAQ